MRGPFVAGVVVLAAAVIAASPPSPAPQTQAPPVFHSATNRVRVDVVVTDDHDRPVTGLTKDAFTIVEHGQAQSITDFQYVSVPVAHRAIDVSAPPVPAPDVASNAEPSPDARAWVIVVDDLHLIESNLVPIKRVLTDIVQSLPRQDEVALVFVNRSDLSQNFTHDTGRLLAAIGDLRAALGFGLDASPLLSADMAKPNGLELNAARATAETLRNVASALAGSGYARRAVIYVGDQTILNPYDTNPIDDPEQYRQELERVYDQARRSDVPIYTVDPRGDAMPEDAVRGGIDAIPSEGIRSAIRANILHQQNWNTQVAINTGGRAFVHNSNLAQAVHDIVEENGSFYLLSYSPDPFPHDGKFHNITVKVNRPGVHVRARQGYVAPGADAEAAPIAATLNTAMGSGLNVSGLPMRVFAAPLEIGAKGMKTLLAVEVDYPPSPDGAARGNDEWQVSVLALDPDAKVKGRSSGVVHVSGVGSGAATYLLDDVVELPAQPLTLRVGVASAVLGRTGTVQLPVSVPKPSDDDLQVGGVVIGVAGAATPEAIGAQALTGLVPFQPVATRTFAATDRLRLFGRLFWGGRETAAVVTVTVDGAPVDAAHTVTLAAEPSPNGKRQAALDTELPLAGLVPGDHVIEIAARLGDGKPVTREIPITVR